MRKQAKVFELAWAKTERKCFNGDDIGVAYGGGKGFVSLDEVDTSNVGSTPCFTAERVLSLSLTSGEYKTSSLGKVPNQKSPPKTPSLCTNPPIPPAPRLPNQTHNPPMPQQHDFPFRCPAQRQRRRYPVSSSPPPSPQTAFRHSGRDPSPPWCFA